MAAPINRKDENRKPHIFVSHSSKDKNTIILFASQLNYLGIDVWLDDWELETGDILDKRIENAISRSRYLGIAITPAFVKSEWCNKELKIALSKEKKYSEKVVLPLIFQKTKMPALLIRERSHLIFYDNYFTELAKLAGMIHGFSTQRISDTIRSRKINSIRAVAHVLTECGWDNISLVDSSYFDYLKRLIGVHTQGNTISFYPDEVKKLNTSIPATIKKLLSGFWN